MLLMLAARSDGSADSAPFNGNFMPGNRGDHLREGQALLGEDPSRQRVDVVILVDGAFPLVDHGAVVVDLVDGMDGASGDPITCIEHRSMDSGSVHPRASMPWQQRWMDVDDTILPPWCDSKVPEVARKADHVDASLLQSSIHPVGGGIRFCLVLDRNDRHGKTGLPATLDSRNRFAVGDHDLDAGWNRVRFEGFGKVEDRAASPRDETAQSEPIL